MKTLREIPGVGEKTIISFNKVGIYKIEDLVGQDALKLYEKECAILNKKIDRCQLYVYRCAIYYAENENAKGLKWWDFKDV